MDSMTTFTEMTLWHWQRSLEDTNKTNGQLHYHYRFPALETTNVENMPPLSGGGTSTHHFLGSS
jgi:hypothetical protein